MALSGDETRQTLAIKLRQKRLILAKFVRQKISQQTSRHEDEETKFGRPCPPSSLFDGNPE